MFTLTATHNWTGLWSQRRQRKNVQLILLNTSATKKPMRTVRITVLRLLRLAEEDFLSS